jgi:hypothetical protein
LLGFSFSSVTFLHGEAIRPGLGERRDDVTASQDAQVAYPSPGMLDHGAHEFRPLQFR